MDFSKLDFAAGEAFSKKIFNLFKCGVFSDTSPASEGFSLLVSFSRNRFRLTEDSVNTCLQSVLGGRAQLFKADQMEDQIFKFRVSSRQVGFLICELGSRSCEWFNLAFFLYNDDGFLKALSFAKRDSGPSFNWESPKYKGSKASYAYVVKNNHAAACSDRPFSQRSPPLSGANAIPVGKSRGNIISGSSSGRSVFSRLVFPRKSVFSRLSYTSPKPAPSRLSFNFKNWQQVKDPGQKGVSFSRIDSVAGADLHCKRCLMSNHNTVACVNPIKCWRCNQDGHISKGCASFHENKKFQALCTQPPNCNFSSLIPTGAWPSEAGRHWFRDTVRPIPHSPQQGPANESPFTAGRSVPTVATPSATLLSPFPPTTSPKRKKPQFTIVAEEVGAGDHQPEPEAMAFLNINPAPMMFPGVHRVLVQGRPRFARVVTPRTPPANEDLAIVTITNPPPGEIPFANSRELILGLIEGHYELRVTEIQRSPFARAQAFVRLGHVTDRDALVHRSPHQFQGFNIEVVSHNRGPNARRVLFNRECWLILIGYPVDARSIDEIRDTIKSFGRLICWQKDSVLSRVVVKARVTDLEDIPHYLVLSEGDDFEGVSTTVQVEIMHQNLLGGGLQDEDIPPPGVDGDFFFPGIGPAQPQQEPHQQIQGQANQPNLSPDLNDFLIEADNNAQQDENQNNDEGPVDAAEEEAQQDFLDLELSLSAPVASKADSSSTSGNSSKMQANVVTSPQKEHGQPENQPDIAEEAMTNAGIVQELQHDPVIQPAIDEVRGNFIIGDNFSPDFLPAVNLHNLGFNVDLNQPLEAHMGVNLPNPMNIDEQPLDLHQDHPMGPNDQNSTKPVPAPLSSNRLQINMATWNNPQADPGWMVHSYKAPADVYRLWAKHFSMTDGTRQVIDIPTNWASFFTLKLLSPAYFDWAKNFLASRAWNFIISSNNSSTLISFALPSVCPPNAEIQCVSSPNDFEDGDKGHTQHTRDAAKKGPMIETEARRSPRLREKKSGFKHQTCLSKNCLACAATPPTIPSALIKSISSDLCKINSDMADKQGSSKSLIGAKKRAKAKGSMEGPQPHEVPKKSKK